MLNFPAVDTVARLAPASEAKLPARTIYSACLSRLGLSHQDAAELHAVRVDTVRSWASGRRPVPEGAWSELRQLEADVAARIVTFSAQWDASGRPDVFNDAGEVDALDLMAAAALVLNGTIPVQAG